MKTRLIGAIVAIVLALAGTVVLTGYVGGADARAAQGAEIISVYVVSQMVPQGTPAADIRSLIEEKRIPAIAAVPGRVTKLSTLAGTVTSAVLEPGEQLITSRFIGADELAARGDVALPVNMQAITVALPVEQVVGGAIKAGDTVGVVIASTTKIAGSADEVSIAKQVFHKVLVTAVQQGATTTVDSGDGAAPAAPASVVMVTLARTTPDVEKLVWGQKFGTVWITIEPSSASEDGSTGVDASQVFQ